MNREEDLHKMLKKYRECGAAPEPKVVFPLPQLLTKKSKKYARLDWEIRRAVLARERCTCQRCHATPPLSELHVHHKSYDSERLDYLDNYELLCSKCHMEVHHLEGVYHPTPLVDPRLFELGWKIKKAKKKRIIERVHQLQSTSPSPPTSQAIL